MGSFLGSSKVSNEQQIEHIISSLDKLCGEGSVSLSDDFWKKEMNFMAINLNQFDTELEDKMLVLCNNLMLNVQKTRNLITFIQHITSQLQEIIQNENIFDAQHKVQIVVVVNLLLLLRVFIQYFMEISAANNSTFDFINDENAENEIKIFSLFFSNLIHTFYHFLPKYLQIKQQQKITAELQNMLQQIEDLYVEITSFILCICSTQLFINADINKIHLRNDNNEHFLLKHFLNQSIEDLTLLMDSFLSITCLESKETNGRRSISTKKQQSQQRIDVELGIITDEKEEEKNESELTQIEDEKSNFLMEIGRSIFRLFYDRFSEMPYISNTSPLNKTPLKDHCLLVLLLLTHQKSECNNFCILMSQLYDESMDTTSPTHVIQQEELWNGMRPSMNAKYLLLNRSFESMFECLLHALTKGVENKSAFNMDMYKLSDANGCNGEISFSTALLTLYTLLENNSLFREYVFAYTEIDKLMLALMHYLNYICYEQMNLQHIALSQTTYLILIILLIFCADINFCTLINSQIVYTENVNISSPNHSFIQSSVYQVASESMEKIAWYRKVRIIKTTKINKINSPKTKTKSVTSSFMPNINVKRENIEGPISLGSFMLTVLIDLLQHNFVNFRDGYINSHCLAIICNLAPFCINLHCYPSQKIINFTHSFIKKINQNIKEKKEQMYKNNKFMQMLTMTVQLMSICRMLISKTMIPGNKYVLYWLMQNKADFTLCLEQIQSILDMDLNEDENENENMQIFLALIEDLGNELSVILDAINYFYDEVTKNVNLSGSALDVDHVLKIINEEAAHWKHHYADDEYVRSRDSIFEYEESDNSVEFFLPFIWRLVCRHSGIHFLDDNVKLFKINR